MAVVVVPGDGGSSSLALQRGDRAGPTKPCSGVPEGTEWLHPVPHEGTAMAASRMPPVLGLVWGEKPNSADGCHPSLPHPPFFCPPPGSQPHTAPLSEGSLSRSDRNQLHASAHDGHRCPRPGPVPTPQEVRVLQRAATGGPAPPAPPGHQPPPWSHGATARQIGIEQLLPSEAARRSRGEAEAAPAQAPAAPGPGRRLLRGSAATAALPRRDADGSPSGRTRTRPKILITMAAPPRPRRGQPVSAESLSRARFPCP